jgi:hypothetical protein
MHPVGQFLNNYVEPFFANYLTPFIGFIIFIVIMSFLVEKFGKNKTTDTLLGSFEKVLLKIKIPYLIVQLILYALVMTALIGIIVFAGYIVSFLGFL